MFTLPAVTAVLLGALGAYFAFMRRLRTLQMKRLVQIQTTEELINVQKIKDLKSSKERLFQRLKDRSQTNKERDENILEELVMDEARLNRLEVNFTERETRQKERDLLLVQRSEKQTLNYKEMKQKRRELKNKDREMFLKLEERAEILHRDLREEVKQKLYEQAEVDVQLVQQQQLIKVEAYRDKQATQILSLGCQRYYDPRPAERLLGYVDLPDSKKKRARLLGGERELLTLLNEVTQVEFCQESEESNRLMLRNAPESYTREIARMTFHRWLNAGAMNETSLRTHHKNCVSAIEKEARRAGKEAAKRLELKGINSEILFLVGKLLFRTSYTQNQWQHAIEASELCGMMAEELGMNIHLARRATLLHDIGKVLWEETEKVGSHAVSGAVFARDHGEIPEVVHPIAAHHQDEAPATALAYLVIAADTLSGARPGARRETSEAFSQHVEQLEGICSDLEGVKQHMIIQGGREVRLVIDPKQHSDLDVTQLTQLLTEQIEDECVFPGQIKVTALREVVSTMIARVRAHNPQHPPQLPHYTHQNTRRRDHR